MTDRYQVEFNAAALKAVQVAYGFHPEVKLLKRLEGCDYDDELEDLTDRLLDAMRRLGKRGRPPKKLVGLRDSAEMILRAHGGVPSRDMLSEALANAFTVAHGCPPG